MLLFLGSVAAPYAIAAQRKPERPGKEPESAKQTGTKSEKRAKKQRKAESEGLEQRWRHLSPRERLRLRKVYREFKARLPKARWDQLKQLAKTSRRPPLKRFPLHWRKILIERARWARRQIAKLPESERRALARLSPAERTARIKEILRPLFKKRLQACRRAAREVFTPLELRLLLQLAPLDRIRALERARENPFGLISPQSLTRFRSLGEKQELVREYLLAPRGLVFLPRQRRGRANQARSSTGKPSAQSPKSKSKAEKAGKTQERRSGKEAPQKILPKRYPRD